LPQQQNKWFGFMDFEHTNLPDWLRFASQKRSLRDRQSTATLAEGTSAVKLPHDRDRKPNPTARIKAGRSSLSLP
jgi:hypothetical protein